MSYIRTPLYQDEALDGKPNSTVLLYGLVCVDIAGQELLIPNTSGLMSAGVHPHNPRLWLNTAQVANASGAPADAVVANQGQSFSRWNLGGLVVTIEALDGSSAPLPSPPPALAWRNSDRHPWMNQKYVRCLGEVTGMSMIDSTGRKNPALVSSRLNMTNGTVAAIPPYGERGRTTVWKVTKANSQDQIQATTDAMVWQRLENPAVALYKVSLAPVTGVGTTKSFTVKADKPLVAVITSAMTGPIADPNTLTDTRSFARLLVGGVPATHRTPKAHRNILPPNALSGSDGHCECGCA